MTLQRGWKARRDAANKRNAMTENRYDVRAQRAVLYSAGYEADAEPVVDEVVAPAPDAPTPEAPAPKAKAKTKGKKAADPVLIDGFEVEDED